MSSPTSAYLAKSDLQLLIDRLVERGFEVIGPTVSQAAIVYDRISSVSELPQGWTDRQGPGEYRLERRDDDELFGFVVGPHSWKRYLFPPLTTLATADMTSNGWLMRAAEETPPKYAFLGVRACELAAIRVQDRVFLEGAYVDPIYQRRRQSAFIIAVNCTQAASTCFCTSMETGPRCQAGFDLALTELPDGFEVEVGTPAGDELLLQLPTTTVSEQQLNEAEQRRQRAVDQITRRMDTNGLRDLLLTRLNHPQWDDVAQRCLACTKDRKSVV